MHMHKAHINYCYGNDGFSDRHASCWICVDEDSKRLSYGSSQGPVADPGGGGGGGGGGARAPIDYRIQGLETVYTFT